MDIMRRASLLRTWCDRLKRARYGKKTAVQNFADHRRFFSLIYRSSRRRRGESGCLLCCMLAPSLPLFLQKHHHLLSSAPLGRRGVILLKNQPAIAHSTADPGDYSLLRRKGGLLNNEILAQENPFECSRNLIIISLVASLWSCHKCNSISDECIVKAKKPRSEMSVSTPHARAGGISFCGGLLGW